MQILSAPKIRLRCVALARRSDCDTWHRLRAKLQGDRRKVPGTELESLKKALDVECETSAFYKQMVASLDDVGRRLFERFVEIEEGHVAIVQAEMDLVSGTGFWFDTAEFSLEQA